MRTNIHNNGGVHGCVVAAQEFANVAKAVITMNEE